MHKLLTPGKTILPLVVAIMLTGTVLAVPPPKVLPEDSEPAIETGVIYSAPAKVASPNENSSDGFVLCLDTTFSFGSFGGTEVWGYTAPNGQVFAIMGTSTGVTIVNATTRHVVTTVPGPTSGCGSTLWREMKTYGHYLYCVSECTGTNAGMMIINLQNLPTSVSFVKSYTLATDPTSHCMSIDTIKGFAYLVKANYSGFRVVSLADPVNPVEFPFVNTSDLHDMTAINDTVYTAEGNRHTFAIYNLANKNAAALIARVTIPGGGYVHNVWPSADRHYCVTTEEIPTGRTMKLWDISNMSNIQFVGEYKGTTGTPHNAHYFNNLIYLAHYEYGVAVVDPVNPASPAEVGHYDTYAGNGDGYNGCWGVWPYNTSGFVFGSQLDGRLVIMKGFATDTDDDTLKAATIVTPPATKIGLDVSITNDYPVTEIVLPIDWAGPYNMLFDSISVAGLRTSGFARTKLAEDLMNSRSVWDLTGAEIPAGSGPVARIYFRVPGAATGDSNLVKIDNAFLTPARVSNNCFMFNPITHAGVVKLPTTSPCCVNRTGNCDGDLGDAVDIGDLTALIDHLFISFAPLACEGEANINGDLAGSVDIADLTALIDHLFISFALTADCL